MDGLLEYLTCTFCRGQFSDPQLLQCGHSFCHKCVEFMRKKGRRTTTGIACPYCSKEVPETGVPNRALQNICAYYAQTRSSSDKDGSDDGYIEVDSQLTQDWSDHSAKPEVMVVDSPPKESDSRDTRTAGADELTEEQKQLIAAKREQALQRRAAALRAAANNYMGPPSAGSHGGPTAGLTIPATTTTMAGQRAPPTSFGSHHTTPQPLEQHRPMAIAQGRPRIGAGPFSASAASAPAHVAPARVGGIPPVTRQEPETQPANATAAQPPVTVHVGGMAFPPSLNAAPLLSGPTGGVLMGHDGDGTMLLYRPLTYRSDHGTPFPCAYASNQPDANAMGDAETQGSAAAGPANAPSHPP